MPFYIVCQKKRNNPRMDVRVCKKCKLKDDCKEYMAFQELVAQKEGPLFSTESRAIQMPVT